MSEGVPTDDSRLPTEPPSPSRLLDPTQIDQLNRAQQTRYLELLTLGASPAAACQRMNLPVVSVLRTLDLDPEFATMLNLVHELLAQNVKAALYRSAMQGVVSAQTFYLKNSPPERTKGEKAEAHEVIHPLLLHLEDDQLFDTAQRELKIRDDAGQK